MPPRVRGVPEYILTEARSCPNPLGLMTELLPLDVMASHSLYRGLHWGHLFQF